MGYNMLIKQSMIRICINYKYLSTQHQTAQYIKQTLIDPGVEIHCNASQLETLASDFHSKKIVQIENQQVRIRVESYYRIKGPNRYLENISTNNTRIYIFFLETQNILQNRSSIRLQINTNSFLKSCHITCFCRHSKINEKQETTAGATLLLRIHIRSLLSLHILQE